MNELQFTKLKYSNIDMNLNTLVSSAEFDRKKSETCVNHTNTLVLF